MTPATIGMHPERVDGDPSAVRWVVTAGTVPVGRIRRAPGALGEMFDTGILTAGLVEHTAVWLWLREDLSWSTQGRAVQAALRDALTDPAGWTVDPAPGEVLALVTKDVLDGSVGDFIRSHGGSVRTDRNADDTVTVALGGACEHCAAAESTLRSRLMGELRRRCPDLAEVDRAGQRLTLVLGG